MIAGVNAQIWLIMAVLLLNIASADPPPKIIYVDADANGLNNGLNWADAYNYLQDALADAKSAQKPVEICVAAGIYKPDRSSAEPNGTGDRKATFQLINGVTIKGGYAGFGKPDPNTRDIVLYNTILYGDIGIPAYIGDNCYHVFYHPWGLKLDATAILDGFTITGGNANGISPHNYGGGMYNYNNSSPTVTNCTFSGNLAEWGGGGMYNWRSSPTVKGCTFRGSSAGAGGGMVNNSSSPTLEGCTFSGNSAQYRGGGVFNGGSSPTIINCTFSANSANDGGGMYNDRYSSPTVTNCTFRSNSATERGGGMFSNDHSSPTLTNCTIADNNAPNGAAMACDSDQYSFPSTVTMLNCIIWNGPNWLWNNDRSTIKVTYSDVQGGWPDEGNIDKDPCFAEPGYWDPNGTPQEPNNDFWVNGNYHLKSQAGRWDPLIAGWIKDDVTSPCIDAGNPSSPIGLEPFPNGGIINMGAYGGTAEASKSYFGEPICETIVAGDINGDCEVNFKDFALLAFHWLEEH